MQDMRETAHGLGKISETEYNNIIFFQLHATDNCRKDRGKSLSTVSLPIPDEDPGIPKYQCP